MHVPVPICAIALVFSSVAACVVAFGCSLSHGGPSGGGICCPIEAAASGSWCRSNEPSGGWAADSSGCHGSGYDGPEVTAGTDEHGCPKLVDVRGTWCGPWGHGVLDAGPADAGPADAGPADAGPADAGPICPAYRADFLCLESSLVEPRRAFTLPLAFDTCACCADPSCVVEAEASTHTLHMSTRLCPDLCACDACNTLVAYCAVPPLESGDWIVEVNGTVAMQLPVFEDSGLVALPPTCVDFAEPDECTGVGVLEGSLMRAAQTCVRGGFDESGRYEIEVTDDCGGCTREGTCHVSVEESDTAEYPPRGDIFVEPRGFIGYCSDGCPEPVCMPVTRTCAVPPLESGRRYRVFVGGELEHTFTAGESSFTCSPVAAF